MNSVAKAVWKSKYAIRQNESFEEGCKRVVAQVAASGMLTAKEQERMTALLIEQKIVPGGRIWFSAGRQKFKGVNCALLHCGDSAEEWGETFKKASLALTSGQGIGTWANEVRPFGSFINGSGSIASGSLTVPRAIDGLAAEIMQGNQRRAACYASINWMHGDVQQWISSKQHSEVLKTAKASDYAGIHLPLEFHNISIQYDPSFLDAYYIPEHPLHQHSHDLWKQHVQTSFMYADPGFQYDADNQVYRNAW